MAKRFIYNFRAAISTQVLESALARFLKKKDIRYTEKDKVFGAVSAYWLPFAMEQEQTCSEKQLKQYARDSIYNLQQRINYIAQSFELSEDILSSDPRRTKHKSQQALSSGSKTEIEDDEQTTSLPESPTPPIAENFLHHDDDDSFDGMFN